MQSCVAEGLTKQWMDLAARTTGSVEPEFRLPLATVASLQFVPALFPLALPT